MALTDIQKAKARRYLGYPDVNRRQHREVEDALGALSSEGETEAADLLTKLASVEANLAASWDRQKVVKAEEVTLAGEGEIRAHRAEGRRLAATLAALLDVSVHRDVFGSSTSSGPAGRG